MSNFTQWALIVAFFVPIAVAAINREKWSARVKAVVFFVVSLVAAAGTAYFQGDLTGKRFLDAALLIVAAAAAFYKGLHKPVGTTDAVEKATG